MRKLERLHTGVEADGCSAKKVLAIRRFLSSTLSYYEQEGSRTGRKERNPLEEASNFVLQLPTLIL